MNVLFDKNDPLIGEFELPHSDPWHNRRDWQRGHYLASSGGIGKAKFKYKIVTITDDDGSVAKRIKITDMIFKEARPFIQDFLFTDNILFQANPDL
jgi:hypothetical protein